MRLYNTIALGLAAVAGVTADKIMHCTQPNTIALTFDDGPYEYTGELLDQLKEANIKATFFINGYNWWKDLEKNDEKKSVIKRAMDEGHQIASHTWAHEIPEKEDDIKLALSKLDDLVEDVTGVRPKYFRAPQGHCKDDCIKFIEGLGYKIIQWDSDTHDWDYYSFDGVDKEEGREKRSELAKEFLTKEWAEQRENYLILMHDVHIHTVRNIVPWVIKNAPFDKYKFVTVAECLGDADGAYNKVLTINQGNATNANNSTLDRSIPGNDTQVPLQADVSENLNANSGALSNDISLFTIAILLFYTLYMVL